MMIAARPTAAGSSVPQDQFGRLTGRPMHAADNPKAAVQSGAARLTALDGPL